MTTEHRVTQLEQREGLLITILERLKETRRHHAAQIEAQRRDSQKLQRMWVWLCRKNGWPEDEDLLG